MKIGSQAFNVAVAAITASNSAKVSFNVPIDGNYSSVYEILIHESNAALIGALVEEGFSLSMTPKGLSVDYYGTKYRWNVAD